MRRYGRSFGPILAIGLMVFAVASCGDDDDEPEVSQATGTASTPATGSPNRVSIEEKDFSYVVTGTLNSGVTTFEFKNTGAELHMAAMGKLAEGKTVEDVQELIAAFAAEGGGDEGGAEPTTTATDTAGATTTVPESGGEEGGEGGEDPFAEIFVPGPSGSELGAPGHILSPGQTQSITVEGLEPGSYAMICFIPTEGEGVPHAAKGMVGGFEIAAEPSDATVPEADATYVIAEGVPLEGPATLTAGENTFAVSGDQPEQEFAIVSLKAGETYQTLDAYFDELFEGEAPPPKGAAADAPGAVLANSFDFPSGQTVYYTVDLPAGEYVFLNSLTDEETGVDHGVKEQLAVTVE